MTDKKNSIYAPYFEKNDEPVSYTHLDVYKRQAFVLPVAE